MINFFYIMIPHEPVDGFSLNLHKYYNIGKCHNIIDDKLLMT